MPPLSPPATGVPGATMTTPLSAILRVAVPREPTERVAPSCAPGTVVLGASPTSAMLPPVTFTVPVLFSFRPMKVLWAVTVPPVSTAPVDGLSPILRVPLLAASRPTMTVSVTFICEPLPLTLAVPVEPASRPTWKLLAASVELPITLSVPVPPSRPTRVSPVAPVLVAVDPFSSVSVPLPLRP